MFTVELASVAFFAMHIHSQSFPSYGLGRLPRGEGDDAVAIEAEMAGKGGLTGTVIGGGSSSTNGGGSKKGGKASSGKVKGGGRDMLAASGGASGVVLRNGSSKESAVDRDTAQAWQDVWEASKAD